MYELALLEQLKKNYEKLIKFYPDDYIIRDYMKRLDFSIEKIKNEHLLKNQI